MRPFSPRLLPLMVWLALAGCAGTERQVEVTTGDTGKLVATGGYDWAPMTERGSDDPRLDNDEMRARLKIAIDRGLAKKGYRAVAGAGVLSDQPG